MAYEFSFTTYTRQEYWNRGGGGSMPAMEERHGEFVPSEILNPSTGVPEATHLQFLADGDMSEPAIIKYNTTYAQPSVDWQAIKWHRQAGGTSFHHVTPYGFRTDPAERQDNGFVWNTGVAYNVTVTVDTLDRNGQPSGTETIFSAPTLTLPRQYVEGGCTYTSHPVGQPAQQVVGDLYIDTDWVCAASLPDTEDRYWSSIHMDGFEYGGATPFNLTYNREFNEGFFPRPNAIYPFILTTHTREEHWAANTPMTSRTGPEEIGGDASLPYVFESLGQNASQNGVLIWEASYLDWVAAVQGVPIDDDQLNFGSVKYLGLARRAFNWDVLIWTSYRGYYDRHFPTPYGFRTSMAEKGGYNGVFVYNDGIAYDLRVDVHTRDRTGAVADTVTAYERSTLTLHRQRVDGGCTYLVRSDGHPDAYVVGDLFVETDYVATISLPDYPNRYWSSVRMVGYEFGGTTPFELRYDRVFSAGFFPRPDPDTDPDPDPTVTEKYLITPGTSRVRFRRRR